MNAVARPPLLAVATALERMLADIEPVETETISLPFAGGRVLAADLAAKRFQPPFPASAMDGYAVRAQDVETVPAKLEVIGQSAAGHGFSGSVGKGQAVRIFTGAPVPKGADTIIIQENVDADNGSILVTTGAAKGKYVRPAGLDFSRGDTLIKMGSLISPSQLSLAAAMNWDKVPVRRKPVVAIIASGDELVMPGTEPGPDQIVASNNFGVAALVERAGGTAMCLGIAEDTTEAIDAKLSAARSAQADIVITLGGASVGDHDLVQEALKNFGVTMDFWRLAMRPGKPVMYGTARDNGKLVHYVGLPGNPVSSLVCTLIFVLPMVRKMLGLVSKTETRPAVLAVPLDANDQREEYMRATTEVVNGVPHVIPFDKQDSSILTLMAQADCLMIRPAHAPAAKAGDAVDIIKL